MKTATKTLLFVMQIMPLCLLFSATQEPVILKQPMSQEVLPGANMRLMVNAYGAEPLFYMWRKDGIKIPGATNKVLTLINVNTNTIGMYTVEISNAFGSVISLPALITVSETTFNTALNNSEIWKSGGNAWWFTESNSVARSGLVFNGEESWIETKIVGPAILSFKWKLESDLLSTFTTEVLQNSRTEIIYDNTANDLLTTFQVNGNYEVGDQIILDTSSLLFPIIINYFSFTYWGVNFSGNELMNVEFFLNNGPNGSPGNIIWGSDWFSIPQTPKSLVIFEDDIRVRLDTPILTWVVKFAGIESGESVGLWLYSPPIIGSNYTDYWQKGTNGWELREMSGYNIDFEARIGYEEYDRLFMETTSGTLDWETKVLSLPAGTNIVRWTFRKNSDLYGGEDSAWLDNVAVLPPMEPVILEHSKPQFGVVGGEAELSVEVIGAEPINFQWLKNGYPVEDGYGIYGINSTKLSFTFLHPDYAGVYTLQCSNAFGCITSQGIPLIIYDESLKERLSEGVDNFQFSFTSGGDGIWDINTTVSHDGIDSISVSPVFTDSGRSWCKTIITNGGGILSFYWKLDSSNACLRFFIDGFNLYSLNSPTTWTNQFVYVAENALPHKVKWIYEQNGPGGSTMPNAFVDQVSFSLFPPIIIEHPKSILAFEGTTIEFQVTASGGGLTYQWKKDGTYIFNNERVFGTDTDRLVITNVNLSDVGFYSVIISNAAGFVESTPAQLTVSSLISLAEVLDATNLAWLTGGDIPWRIDINTSHDGVDAAQSGTISTNQISWISTTVTGPGTLSFYVKVSSEQYYDVMEFLMNDEVRFVLSGEVNWQYYWYDIPPGPVNLKWQYKKNPSFSAGLDTVWLDQVIFEPYPPTPPNILNGPKNISVEKDDFAEFDVNVCGAWPLYYQWYKNGVPISDNEKINGSQSSHLWIPKSHFSDSGYYFLVISNAFGVSTSQVVVLNVENRINWNWINPHPQGNALRDIIFFNGALYVAGDVGTMLKSVDSLNWKVNYLPLRVDICSLNVSDGILYAIGSNVLFYTTDGVEWNFVKLPFSSRFYDIIKAFGKFFIVGENSTIASSSNLVNWQTLYSQTDSGIIKSIAFSESILVAVSTFGDIFTSHNGTIWTVNKPFYSQLEKVRYINNKFFAVGKNCSILISSDGINWTFSHYLPNLYDGFNEINEVNSYLVAYGNSMLAISSNQTDWFLYSNKYSGNILGGLSYNGKLLVAGEDGKMYSTTNGVDLSEISTGSRHNIKTASYRGLNRIVCLTDTNKILITTNIYDWEEYNITNIMTKIVSGADKYIGIKDNGIYASINGYNWEYITNLPNFNSPCSSLFYENNRYVLFHANYCYLSEDATNWTYHIMNDTYCISDVAYGGKYYAAGICGSSLENIILSSTDGKYWTPIYSSEYSYGFNINSIAVSDSTLVIATTFGKLIVSTNGGETWFDVPINGENEPVKKVRHNNGLFFAIGTNGNISTSKDGILWTRRTRYTNKTLSDLLFIGTNIFTFGDGGVILNGFKEEEGYLQIISQPKPQIITYGNTAIFSVNATGKQPIEYQWYKNGIKLIDSVQIHGTTNNILIIENAKIGDIGTYYVEIKNPLGIVISKEVQLKIFPLLAYGNNYFGQTEIPISLTNIIKISAGLNHSIALKDNGDVIGWGWNLFGQANNIIGANVVDISAGDLHNLALLADGRVIGWGNNELGQISIPFDFTNVVAIAAGGFHSMALTEDGKVIAWGDNSSGQTNVPKDLLGVVSIAAGYDHSVALLNNGKVIIWGGNVSNDFISPPQFSNIVAISAGKRSTIGLKCDGSIVRWGNVPDTILSLENVTDVEMGYDVGIALKSDGTVVTWNNKTQTAPLPVQHIEYGISVSAGGSHYLILQGDGKPFITVNPVSTHIRPNKKLVMSSLASGQQPLYYQWYKDWFEVPHATNAYLIFENIADVDGGYYYCVVSNPSGTSASKVANVSVEMPFSPIILTHPASTNIMEYNTLFLEVNVSGTYPLYFQWQKDNKNITGAIDSRLTITNITFNDSGAYSVIVSNEYGTITSDYAFVNILSSPKIIVQPYGGDIQLDGVLVLSVDVVGTEPIFYQWRKDGIPLANETNSSIFIIAESPELQGTYDVIVSNHVGIVFSHPAIVTIGEPPTILKHPTSITKIAGENGVFTVNATGTPPLFYQWKFYGIDMPDATNATLVINNVNNNHVGTYWVTVANKYGEIISESANLAVVYPPRYIEHPQNLKLKVGDSLMLTASATGTTPLTYQWFKDDMPLLNENNTNLVILSANTEDSGNYWVVAVNEYGIATSKIAHVVVEEPALFEWIKTISGIKADSIKKIASDKNGNIIAVGIFEDKVLLNGQLLESRGGKDILIIKYSNSGNIIWFKHEGGNGDDFANSVSIASDNSIYVAGVFRKCAIFGNMRVTNTLSISSQIMVENNDIFIAKYSPNGELLWIKTAGGQGDDTAIDIVNDINGNAMVCGVFEDVSKFGNIEVYSVGSKDIFVAKYDTNGACQWVSAGGGFGNDLITAITSDEIGNIYITGSYTRGARFGNIPLKSYGDPDGFVAKYDSGGNIKWIKQINGLGNDICNSIAIDNKENIIYVFGSFGGIETNNYIMTIDNRILNARCLRDAFLLILNAYGNVINIKHFDFNQSAQPYEVEIFPASVQINNLEEIVLSGFTSMELDEGFLAILTAQMEKIIHTTISQTKIFSSLNAMDSGILISGEFKGMTEFGTTQITSQGESDGFIAKISRPTMGPPIIITQPTDKVVKIGGFARFETGVIGTPPINFQWYKDGQPITADTSSVYEIVNVVEEDVGYYYVVASNSFGSVTSESARLQIAMPPIITDDLTNYVVTYGEDIYLSAKAFGTEPLTYLWYFNDKLLAITPAPIIYISDGKPEHSGKYCFVVSNEIGIATSQVAVVTVGEYPKIISQPKAQQTILGLSTEFSVEARGSQPIFYQWYFNGTPITEGTSEKLRLFNVTQQMSGNYHVVVSNYYGTVTSETVRLYVAVPPQILVQPESHTVRLCETVTFAVVPVDALGVNYQWFKNDKSIPGATNSFLEINNVNFADAGTYYVVLFNFIGATKSTNAYLKIAIPELPMADSFEDRGTVYTISGFGRSNNSNATRQIGEPLHAGRRLTNSMWLSWIVPISGIATISLQGSTVDTVLSVYTGSQLTNLVPISYNDDAGIGVKYSIVRFNANAGEEYIVAVNSVGAGGEIVMQWTIETTSARVPELTSDLADTNVFEGANVTFTVTTATGRGIVNWYFNGDLIASNINSLTIENVTSQKVGIYFAEIIEGNRTIYTKPIRLNMIKPTLGADTRISTQDKLAYLIDMVFENTENNLSQHSYRRIYRTQGPARGFTGSQVFNTYGSTTDPGEPLHCGILGGASEWFVYQAPTNGLLTIDTFGSTFDTVLAVYDVPGNVPPYDYTDLRAIACNNDVSLTNLQSKVSFNAVADTIYYIAIDGVSGVRGIAQLNYNLIAPPSIVSHPEDKNVNAGQNVNFSVTATGTNLCYTWRFNSINLSDKTNSLLILPNVQTNHAGYYSVIISNEAGTAISSNALLTVNFSPVIISNPASKVVVKGGSVSLSSLVSGTSPLSYRWLFNSTELSNQTNNALTLNNVQLTNSGEYCIVVSNSIGIITSSTAYLTVVEPNAQNLNSTEDSPILITLGPASTNGIVLGYTIMSAPTNGTLSGIGNIRTYSPATNYYGNDAFGFVVSDGANTSSPATVSITITPVNDPPTIGLITNVVEYANTPINLTIHASDIDGPSLIYSLGSGTPSGANINPTTGVFTWIPTTNNAGTNLITFLVNDNGVPNLSDSRIVYIVILPLNPIAILQSEPLTNGIVKYLIQGRMKRTNTIESTIIFNKWSEETNIVPLSEIYEWHVPTTSQQRKFFRIKVQN